MSSDLCLFLWVQRPEHKSFFCLKIHSTLKNLVDTKLNKVYANQELFPNDITKKFIPLLSVRLRLDGGARGFFNWLPWELTKARTSCERCDVISSFDRLREAPKAENVNSPACLGCRMAPEKT